jgi:hypothetical protein
MSDDVKEAAERTKDYHSEMQLPDGMTCADCVYIKRCVAIGYSWPERTQCDFHPSKFIAINRMLSALGIQPTSKETPNG